MQLDPTPGPISDLVSAARAIGRAAEPSTFHTETLARLLGWSGEGLPAVALEVADGVADFVPHAAEADVILVRVDAGIVEVDPAHAVIELQPGLSDEQWCRVSLPPLERIPLQPWDVEAAVARAAIVRCADAVGAAEAALEAAVAHVSARQSGGGPLAAKQAVQHRCADMLIDVTLAADAVLDAAGVADRGVSEAEVRLAAAYAKATAIESCRRVTASAHQLAGGQGILASAPFHRWYRRVKAAEPVLGGSRAHRATVAAALLDA